LKTGGKRYGCGAAGVGHVEDDKRQAALPAAGQAQLAENLPEYQASMLFAGRREIVIHHAGAAYRMKITRQGKLILNK
jgi:hemin uptake protein HemP